MACGKKRLKMQRARLHAADPHCSYCGCVTILPMELPPRRRNLRDTPNMATIDHVRSKLDPRRRRYEPGVQRHVLACARCNSQRGDAEVLSLPAEELWRRSGRAPQVAT